MKRIIDFHLEAWKNGVDLKPLIVRGARQVGKTHAVRVLSKQFDYYIEVNLETSQEARLIFEQDFDIDRILLQLGVLTGKKIIPGTTLLFLDEIQYVPKAILALRYFNEMVPDLHVIAAGSLIDFVIEQVGVPVGRVTTLYMYPLSFLEFLAALGHQQWVQIIIDNQIESMQIVHEKLLSLLGIYLAIGGMPAAVNQWVKTKDPREVAKVHANLIYAYEQDFGKYAKTHQIKYLNLLFLKAIEQIGNKFVFSHVGEYQKRELAPALELLEKAGLFYPVVFSSGQGIPIGAQADLNYFKIIFLDVGLCQSLLNLDLSAWFLDLDAAFVNKGAIVEAFVGQELLTYFDPIRKGSLYYWQGDSRGSTAEVDYLIQVKNYVVPIEVKAGFNKRIVSMHIFLDSHLKSPYGLRFWAGPAQEQERLRSYPLYAVGAPLLENNKYVKESLLSLINK